MKLLSVLLTMSFSQLALAGFDVQKIAVGRRNTCILSTEGKVKCWGDNTYATAGSKDPNARVGLDSGTMGPNLSTVDLGTNVLAKDICLGFSHGCAATKDGKVKCWGKGSDGQLGIGQVGPAFANGDALPYVDLGKNFFATKVECGSAHTCAVDAQQKAKCWGDNMGNLGVGDTVKRGLTTASMGDKLPYVSLDKPMQKLTTGANVSCAKSSDGIRCWGNSYLGAIGQESLAGYGGSPKPTIGEIPLIKLLGGDQKGEIVDLTSSLYGSCVLIAIDGVRKVKCWGDGRVLGLGEGFLVRGVQKNSMGTALPFVDLDLADISEIQGNATHVCARNKLGRVKCWGLNNSGKLGQGDDDDRGRTPSEMGKNLMPIDLGLPAIALSVGATADHACALLINRQIKCWGAGGKGQLGYENGLDFGVAPGQMGDNLPFVRFE